MFPGGKLEVPSLLELVSETWFYLILIFFHLMIMMIMIKPPLEITAFWDVAPCSLVEVDQHFTLVYTARAVCDHKSLHDELEFFGNTVRQSLLALISLKRIAPPPTKAHLGHPSYFVSMTFSCISQMLSRHNIESVGLPLWKITSFHRPLKYDLGLEDSK
jgi:hypothetical protein